jgi:uncharacterized protein YfaS (alpha-2-macroglobulin family)
VLVGVYPNPAEEWVTLQLYTTQAQRLQLILYNAEGQRVASYDIQTPSAGTHYYQVPLEGLARGVFLLELRTAAGGSHTYRLLKR